MPITKKEFEKLYAEGSNMTIEELNGLVAHSCNCKEDYCEGWKMESENLITDNRPKCTYCGKNSDSNLMIAVQKANGWMIGVCSNTCARMIYLRERQAEAAAKREQALSGSDSLGWVSYLK